MIQLLGGQAEPQEKLMSKAVLVSGTLAFLSAMVGQGLAEEAGTLADCSARDLAAIASIEEHGRAGDISPERLYSAAVIMQQARNACREKRFAEGLALYDFVLTLGPIVANAPED